MNRNFILWAAALASTSALAFAQDSDNTTPASPDAAASNPDGKDADTLDLDGKIVTGPVYIVQDPKTGKTYVLVPDDGSLPPQAPAKAWSPVRGVTAWA